MNDISDAQVDELLRQAEQRLQKGSDVPASRSASAVAAAGTGVKSSSTSKSTKNDKAATNKYEPTEKQKLSVREPQPKAASKGPSTEDNAGSKWFNLPKTDLTPELKRDWQLLRMRNILDPKNQKKALHAAPPKYAQVGEIIQGPTEFFSARMTKKERKNNLLQEAMYEVDQSKLKGKYAGIQKQKTSGGKAYYQKLVKQRRRGQN